MARLLIAIVDVDIRIGMQLQHRQKEFSVRHNFQAAEALPRLPKLFGFDLFLGIKAKRV